MSDRPFDSLNNAIGERVLVRLKGDQSINGVLKAFDVHLNVVLENAEVDGETKKKYSKLMVRGDSIISIAL